MLGIGRHPDHGAAVGGAENAIYRGLITGHQAFVGIGTGVAESQHCRCMFEQAADKITGRLAQVGIAVLVIEQRLSVFKQVHVDMQAIAGLSVNRLGHERHRLALLESHVLDEIFGQHGLVGHFPHAPEFHLDLDLTRSGYFVVVVFDGDTVGLH